MKICTWNIWSKGGSAITPRHWLKAAHYLQEEGPDLIALQEVDRHWGQRTESRDIAREMAEVMGFDFFFFPSIDLDGRQYGNAILSRFPILAHGQARLSPDIPWERENRESEPRAAVWARVEKPRPVTIVSCHLAVSRDLEGGGVVEFQIEQLIGLVVDLKERFPGDPLLVCGDFNMTPGSPGLEALNRVIARQGQALPTWPVYLSQATGGNEEPPPRFAIDHIFANSPVSTWRGTSELSDHLPLFGRLGNPGRSSKAQISLEEILKAPLLAA